MSEKWAEPKREPQDNVDLTSYHKNGIDKGYDNHMMQADKADGTYESKPSTSSATDKNSDNSDGEGKQKKEKQPMVGLSDLYRFADKLDGLLISVGILLSCANGCALPGMIIVFGQMTDSFVGQSYNCTANTTVKVASKCNFDLMAEMSKFAIYYTIIGCGVIVAACGQVTFLLMTAYRQTYKMRMALFAAILRQDIGWFDTHEIGELNTRISDDVNKVQDGIGDKVSNFFQWISAFVCGIVIGFVHGWKLTLVILAVSPLLVLSGGFMTFMMTSFTAKELKAYAKAGAVAEEVLGAIRTVVAFGGQQKELDRYTANLDDAKSFGQRKGLMGAIGMAIVFFVIFAVYALAFWYGSKLVREDDAYTVGNLLIVFFGVMIGAFSLGHAAPNLQAFATARGAAFALWQIIDRVPPIDSSSPEGLKPDSMDGYVEFENVSFRYPSREEIQILKGLSITVKRGQTAALVGASGCGKSTTVQLLQRFYDPEAGSVHVDGRDIRLLNIKWLRDHIGVVSQEPVLFGTTIEENIRYGREGVTMEAIEQATKMANAYNFIQKLPLKFKTLVGERGAQLSGGQKQRIAIARALVRDPRILLLDEATSALDTESEATVQAALDKAREGRTTLVIAHRLSTIRNADIIYGVKNGVVVESGTHESLMAAQGLYYDLVNKQQLAAMEEGNDQETGEVTVKIVSDDLLPQDRPRFNSLVGQTSTAAGANAKLAEEADVSMMRVVKMNSPEWPFILFGCIGSMCNGIVQPGFALIFANILKVFAEKDLDKQQSQALFYSMMFLVIGVGAGVAMFLQNFMFCISGERLTMRVRCQYFKALLRQDQAYFDSPSNSVGALTTRLATDASAVQGASGSRFGTIIQSVSCLGAGFVIGFIYSWKLTLMIIGFVPFMMAAGMLQMKIMGGTAKRGQVALEGAGKVAIEAIENIRTVAALCREPTFLAEYKRLNDGPHESNMKKAIVYGLAFSFSQAIMYFANAATFYFGAWLIKNDGLEYDNMFKVFSAIVFGAMAVGQASQFAPDYGKAKTAANRMFGLFDRVPTIDSYSTDGEKPASITGTVEFEGVQFSYPTRDSVQVLKGLNLRVEPGQTIALVGGSGCGKSTTVQLLERFYDVLGGGVFVDRNDMRNYNVQALRQHIGIVSQEPILFDTTIAENIAYGANFRTVPMDEIIAAARQANIHNFIESLPEGYQTRVGDKGAQLSGGQKQRVAIARALVRNPKILLLDEATSALDTESEQIVQEALDKARLGRTCIVIAHRLSTIQNADCIYVIQSGRVAERGTHQELLAEKGLYYKLSTKQGQQQR